MVNEIEMNTSMLAGDIESLESTVGQLETQLKNMFDSVNRLDTMWNGAANSAFNQQFQSDYAVCQEMCRTLRELIASLDHAADEYDKCEQSVNSMIRSLNI